MNAQPQAIPFTRADWIGLAKVAAFVLAADLFIWLIGSLLIRIG